MQRCGHHTGYAVVWQRVTLDREHSSGTFDVRFESNPYGFPGGLTKARGRGREMGSRDETSVGRSRSAPLRHSADPCLYERGPPRDDAA